MAWCKHTLILVMAGLTKLWIPCTDNGRELKVSAGYKYVPRPPSKENNLFEAIEDVEENLIMTPM